MMGKEGSACAWHSRRAGPGALPINRPGWGLLAPRLLRALNRWRQRRVRLRHDFSALSDRTLVDIGLRRADVIAASIGVMPLGRPALGAAPAAAICRLPARPRCVPVADDLTDAA